MKLTRWCAWMLCLALFCGFAPPVTARAAGPGETESPENLALTAVVSGSSGQRETRGPDKAVDGKQSTYFFANSKDSERYLLLDLGKVLPIEQLALFFFRESPAYSIQFSIDGEQFEDVVSVTDGAAGKKTERVFTLPSLPSARYIKLLERQCYQMNGDDYSFAIYEMEVYGAAAEPVTAADILQQLDAPTLSADGEALLPPDCPDPRYRVSLYGCEPRQVIALDGTVSQPLCDTEVSVLYQVQSSVNADDSAKSTKAFSVTVPGKNPENGGNEPPNVVPSLREWQGGEGDFCLTGQSTLVLSPPDAEALGGAAEQIAAFFADMLGRPLPIRTGTPAKGDVLLRLAPTLAPLGPEGYTLDSGDIFIIAADAPQGVLYGGVSLTQVLWQDASHSRFPRGQARDYPRYGVRGGMLDLASAYITPEELSELAGYMAWFKLNELHLHLNDSSADAETAAYRLACETYPSLPAADGFYTKEEFRALAEHARSLGVEVVGEIVGPGRGACFQNAAALPLDNTGTLDLATPEAAEQANAFLQQLTEEYLTGDEPFLQGHYYDIGAGIYGEPGGPQLIALADALAGRAQENGKQARVWYMDGIESLCSPADILLWTDDPAAVQAVYGTGRGVIDTRRSLLQLSTAGRDGLPHDLPLAAQYDRYAVEYLAMAAGRSPADPQTRGAIFCLWNEQACFGGGYATCDLFDRMKNAVALTAEKTWCGLDDKQTGARFASRFAKVGMRAGSVNPGRFAGSRTDVLLDLDFSSSAADRTANHRDGTAEGGVSFGTLEGRSALCLDGTGALVLPLNAVGYPYTARVDLYCSPDMPPDALLLKGVDGSFYLNLDETGCPGYRRGGDTFRFDGAALPAGRWCTLVLTCDRTGTALYIDGQKQPAPMLCGPAGVRQPDYSAFLLPTARIGEGLAGGIAALTLYNRVLTDDEILTLTPALSQQPQQPQPDNPTESTPPQQPEPADPPSPSPKPDQPEGGHSGGGNPSGGGIAGGSSPAPAETQPIAAAVLLPNGTKRTESTEADGTRRIIDLTPAGVQIDTRISPQGEINATVSMPEGAPPQIISVPVAAPHAGLTPLIRLPDGSERVIPKSAVTEDGLAFLCDAGCSIRVADRGRPFDDLANRAWAENAVAFVTARGLFGGMTQSDFVPDGSMSRGMLATVLHRLESSPLPAGRGGFDDLADGRYYSEAAAWAAEAGLIRGIGAAFAADQPVSREQLVTILHRYAGSPRQEGAPDTADAAGVSSWAKPAMQWALAQGLLAGRPGGLIDPKTAVTRAETAVILERLVNWLLAA